MSRVRKEKACAGCGAPIAGGKTGYCCHCVNKRVPRATLKFPWTPEWDRMLREGYARCVLGKPTVAIDRVQAATGYPRHIVRLRAQRLGITRDTRKPWRWDEESFLRLQAGRTSAKQIARYLHRSHASVVSHMEGMRLSAHVIHGYSLTQLAELLGVSFHQVRKFLRSGWLKMNASHRINASDARYFLIERMDHLDLRLMNQRWLKEELRAAFRNVHDSARRAA